MNFVIFVHLVVILFSFGVFPIHCYWWDNDGHKDRIFQGTLARISDHPYVVSIVKVKQGKEDFHCAGTIVNVTSRHGKAFGFVLTAGSCIHKLNKEKYKYGDVRIRSNSEYWSSCDCKVIMEEYRVQKWDLHPYFDEEGTFGHYNTRINYHDIGIIAIVGHWRGAYDTTVNLLPNVRYRKSSGIKSYQTYTAVGWGKIERHDFDPQAHLRARQNLKEIPLRECRYMYRNRTRFPDDIFCLTVGPCEYDNGGPVLVTDDHHNTYLAGIVSTCAYCFPEFGNPEWPLNFPALAVIPARNLKFIFTFVNSDLHKKDDRFSSKNYRSKRDEMESDEEYWN